MLVLPAVLVVSSITSSAAHATFTHLETLAASSATLATLPTTCAVLPVHLIAHQTMSNHFQIHFHNSGLFNNWKIV
jgi:hypothetical protein